MQLPHCTYLGEHTLTCGSFNNTIFRSAVATLLPGLILGLDGVRRAERGAGELPGHRSLCVRQLAAQ